MSLNRSAVEFRGVPDPATATWPRRTDRVKLEPLDPKDARAMWSYRRLPEVCEFLTHDVLALDEVRERIEQRLAGSGQADGRCVRGVALLVSDRMVGDAMLRTQQCPEGRPQLWIGYALHPDVWGRGIATEVVRGLLSVGAELGLPVLADVYLDNVASQRVLEKAGLERIDQVRDESGRALLVYAAPSTTVT